MVLEHFSLGSLELQVDIEILLCELMYVCTFSFVESCKSILLENASYVVDLHVCNESPSLKKTPFRMIFFFIYHRHGRKIITAYLAENDSSALNPAKDSVI